MKFTLAENIKHILAEKYLLSERFILNEASEKAIVVLNNWFTKITRELEQSQEKVDQILETNKVSTNAANLEADLKAITDAAKDVDISMNNPAEQNEEVKADLLVWYKAVKNLIEKIPSYNNNTDKQNVITINDPEAKQVKDDLAQMNKYLSIGNFDKEAARKLYNKLFDAIKDTFGKAISTKSKISSDKVEKLTETCNTFKERANELITLYMKLDYSKLDDSTVSQCITKLDYLSDELNKIVNLSNQINFRDYENKFNNYIAAIGNASGSMKDFTDLAPVAKLAELKKQADSQAEKDATKAKEEAEAKEQAKKDAAEAEEQAKKNASKRAAERANSQKRDWKTLYAQCRTPDDFSEFWKDYYEIEWGDRDEHGNVRFPVIADGVKSFGKYFTQDLEKVGWDTLTNPLVNFLKNPEINKEIGVKINQTVYIKLHNALVRHILEPRDLTASENSTYGEWNLIFNLNLYDNLETLDDYLYLQHTITSKIDFLEDSKAVEKWKTDQKGRGIVLNNLMLSAGNVDNLSAKIKPGGPLREVSEAEQLISQLFGSVIDRKDIATNDDVRKIVEQLNGEMLCKKVIVYLTFALNILNQQKAVDDADAKTGGEIYKLRNTGLWPKQPEIDSYENIIGLKKKDYTTKQLTELLVQLAAKAGIYTPEPPKK